MASFLATSVFSLSQSEAVFNGEEITGEQIKSIAQGGHIISPNGYYVKAFDDNALSNIQAVAGQIGDEDTFDAESGSQDHMVFNTKNIAEIGQIWFSVNQIPEAPKFNMGLGSKKEDIDQNFLNLLNGDLDVAPYKVAPKLLGNPMLKFLKSKNYRDLTNAPGVQRYRDYYGNTLFDHRIIHESEITESKVSHTYSFESRRFGNSPTSPPWMRDMGTGAVFAKVTLEFSPSN